MCIFFKNEGISPTGRNPGTYFLVSQHIFNVSPTELETDFSPILEPSPLHHVIQHPLIVQIIYEHSSLQAVLLVCVCVLLLFLLSWLLLLCAICFLRL